jgi:hypothetical protein
MSLGSPLLGRHQAPVQYQACTHFGLWGVTLGAPTQSCGFTPFRTPFWVSPFGFAGLPGASLVQVQLSWGLGLTLIRT